MPNSLLRSRKTWIGFSVGLVGPAALPFLVDTAIERLNGPRPNRRAIKAVADVRAIEEAVDLYAAEHGHSPSAQEGLAALVPSQLVKFPVDPWGNPHAYLPGAGRSHVVSYGSADCRVSRRTLCWILDRKESHDESCA
jgi:hypothetical protein